MTSSRPSLENLDDFTSPQKYAGKLEGKVVRDSPYLTLVGLLTCGY
jgi:hypothetical protein